MYTSERQPTWDNVEAGQEQWPEQEQEQAQEQEQEQELEQEQV